MRACVHLCLAELLRQLDDGDVCFAGGDVRPPSLSVLREERALGQGVVARGEWVVCWVEL